MKLGSRTPVLVGVGAVAQRHDDPRQAVEAFELMARALDRASEDAGSRRLLREASSIRVPRGFWQYSDPGRLVAERLGIGSPRTVLAEIGVLQQTLLSDACRAVASGEESIALVTGAEARFRELRARISGVEVDETAQVGIEPDQKLAPSEPLIHDLEVARGIMMPVRAFAIVDNALRFHEGRSIDAQRDEIARLWASFSKIAGENPSAWRRDAVSFEEIRNPGPRNRMIAFPYTKLHNSDWNVDQAAGLIICSLEVARSFGVPEERWVFPTVGTESNHVVNISQRAEIHRSIGAELAGARALEWAELSIDEIQHIELYSCFPAPVRVMARALGVSEDRALTVTGGMAFAGGPLNNYVLQATVRMAEVLRADPGSVGLVSSLSGFFNKQGYGIWSTAPSSWGFRFSDVSAEAESASSVLELAGDYRGEARVASYTVSYQGNHPAEAIAICDLPDGRRTIGVARDRSLAESMLAEEFCGRSVAIGVDGVLDPG